MTLFNTMRASARLDTITVQLLNVSASPALKYSSNMQKAASLTHGPSFRRLLPFNHIHAPAPRDELDLFITALGDDFPRLAHDPRAGPRVHESAGQTP